MATSGRPDDIGPGHVVTKDLSERALHHIEVVPGAGLLALGAQDQANHP